MGIENEPVQEEYQRQNQPGSYPTHEVKSIDEKIQKPVKAFYKRHTAGLSRSLDYFDDIGGRFNTVPVINIYPVKGAGPRGR